jgi:hypothetical protein
VLPSRLPFADPRSPARPQSKRAQAVAAGLVRQEDESSQQQVRTGRVQARPRLAERPQPMPPPADAAPCLIHPGAL